MSRSSGRPPRRGALSPGGPQLVAGALGPGRGARVLEGLERGPQRRPGLRLAPRPPQPLAGQELGAGAVERAPVALVERERGGEARLGLLLVRPP